MNAGNYRLRMIQAGNGYVDLLTQIEQLKAKRGAASSAKTSFGLGCRTVVGWNAFYKLKIFGSEAGPGNKRSAAGPLAQATMAVRLTKRLDLPAIANRSAETAALDDRFAHSLRSFLKVPLKKDGKRFAPFDHNLERVGSRSF